MVKLIITAVLVAGIAFAYQLLREDKRDIKGRIADTQGNDLKEPSGLTLLPEPEPEPEPEPIQPIEAEPEPEPEPGEIVMNEDPEPADPDEPEPEPEPDLPPGDPDLRERAIGLIEDAREEREEKFTKNARSLVFQLGVRARNSEPDEAALLKRLEEDVVDNRVPIVADVRDLPEDLGELFESTHIKEEEIESGHLSNLTRIRDAYVSRLERAAAETSDEKLKQRLLAQAERAGDIDAWVGLLSPEPEIERKRSSGDFGSGFAGRWEIQTDNLTQWVADANGVVTINDGQWKGKTATWNILADGTLEVHWPDKPKPYTFTRDGDGWTGKTSFGKPASLTPGDW